jgi:hypothetical protein
MVHSGGPAQDSIVMCLEADCRVCMLDRAGYSNELFRFSTTKMQWEQLTTQHNTTSSQHNTTLQVEVVGILADAVCVREKIERERERARERERTLHSQSIPMRPKP